MSSENNASDNHLADLLTSQTGSYEDFLREAPTYPLDELIEFLSHENPRVREKTITALKMKRDVTAIEVLSNYLNDPEIEVAGEAAIAIVELTPNLKSELVRIPSLLDTLIATSRERGIGRRAVRILRHIDDPKTIQPLIDVLCQLDPDPKLFEPVKDGLTWRGKASVEPLIEALKNEYYHVREIAAEVLGEIGDTRAVEPLSWSLQHDNHDFVQQAAAEALGKLGDLRAVEPLIDALSNPDEFVRLSIVKTLGTLKDKKAIDPLRQMLADPNENVRNAAQKSLSQLFE